MFSTDQTHLRRYFTTLGVAIAAGTLSLAGLFLKLQQDLIVKRSTLARLTPTARDALLRRQEYLSLGTAILPWFVLVGFLGGIGLSVYGLVGWAKRQKVIDEREDIGLRKEQVELRILTDPEKEKKLDRDAQESAREAASASPGTSQPNLANLRTEIADIEGVLAGKLREIYRSSNVVSGVGFEGWGVHPNIEVDCLVQSDTGPIIFELKYALNRESVVMRIRDGLLELKQALGLLASARGRLVVVVEDFAKPEWIERWNVRAQEIAQELNLEVKTYIGRHSDFLALPAKDFAAQLGLSYPENNNQ